VPTSGVPAPPETQQRKTYLPVPRRSWGAREEKRRLNKARCSTILVVGYNHQWALRARSRYVNLVLSRGGMTLLELLILLTAVAVVVLVALPTLHPPKAGNLETFARERLYFIYEKERAYFLRNGTYNSFAELASGANGGPYLDRRFLGEDYRERGVVFSGPDGPTEELLLTATLPDGWRITLDSKGRFRTHKPPPQQEPGGLLNPEQVLPDFRRPGAEGEPSGRTPPAGSGEGPPPVELPANPA